MLTSHLNQLTAEQRSRIMRRAESDTERVRGVVREILDRVRAEGDAALRDYTRRFDGVEVQDLRVSEAEVERAYASVSPAFLHGLRQAATNITTFHQAQLEGQHVVETAPGIHIWRVRRAIERVGLYVPGGRKIYPSSVLMAGIPARLVGCKLRVMCAPPAPDGSLPAPTLVAAKEAGIEHIYKVGGAQAIGAMAYGTETIPAVYKVFGAGNLYVAVAKLLVRDAGVELDMPAGPSEVLIIADGTADPRFVAADLMSQAEHGEESAGVLLTTSPELAAQVAAEVERQLVGLATAPTIRKALDSYGAILVCTDVPEAIAFANEYAPEHLEIILAGDGNHLALEQVTNAGAVFLGPYAPEPAGDYASGSNHVLPTGGAARLYSGLSVDSFSRMVEVQELTRDGLASIRASIDVLATTEGLPAHRNAVEVRFDG